MGVIYKLKEDVVHFIISERQGNPLASCRQLAESASLKFGLRLSKSSVHDVLKESGIITPRGRKPKDKFEIPQEKRKQIQSSLCQVKLLPNLGELQTGLSISPPAPAVILPEPPIILPPPPLTNVVPVAEEVVEISPEYEGAGKIFIKAALWDLGILSEDNIKAADWGYYLTYSKGIKVAIENNRSFFIEMPIPLERCIKEVADGLINNVKPFILHRVSDEEAFKACMEAQAGYKIENIEIVDEKDHVILKFDNIMECNRKFSFENIIFVENYEISCTERSKSVFFPQLIDNDEDIEEIMNLKGFDASDKEKKLVTLLISDIYPNKSVLQEAAEKLNRMYLRDEQGRLVGVKIEAIPLR